MCWHLNLLDCSAWCFEPMEFHLDSFDGPLDLLLHLISKNKVSIYDIPIAEIITDMRGAVRRGL